MCRRSDWENEAAEAILAALGHATVSADVVAKIILARAPTDLTPEIAALQAHAERLAFRLEDLCDVAERCGTSDCCSTRAYDSWEGAIADGRDAVAMFRARKKDSGGS